MNNELLIKFYRYGYDLDVIAEDLGTTVEDVKEELINFKKRNIVKRRFNDYLKGVMIDRYLSGIAVTAIEMELKLGRQSLARILNKLNIKRANDNDNEYKEINHESFNICPDCNSNHVNDVSEWFIDEWHTTNSDNSYCLDCGTEWFKDDNGVVKKVLFANLE